MTHLLKTHIKQSILPAFGDSKRRDNLSFTRDFHHCAHDLDAPKKKSPGKLPGERRVTCLSSDASESKIRPWHKKNNSRKNLPYSNPDSAHPNRRKAVFSGPPTPNARPDRNSGNASCRRAYCPLTPLFRAGRGWYEAERIRSPVRAVRPVRSFSRHRP